MANVRIYELSEDTTPAADDYIATDKSGEAAPSKVNVNKLLLSSGTITGSASQAQSFGATGIKADVIAESTGAAGVTIDGVLLKDSNVVLTAGQVIKPTSDSTTALKLAKNDGTAIVTVDTTNSVVSISGGSDLLRLSANSAHILLTEADTSQQFRVEVSGSNFSFTDVGVKTRLVIATGANPYNNIIERTGINKAFASAMFHVVTDTTTRKGAIIQMAASHTVNTLEIQDSGGNILIGANRYGDILTSRATANTNTPSGATAYQLAIYNAAGTLLGYLPLYGSAW